MLPAHMLRVAGGGLAVGVLALSAVLVGGCQAEQRAQGTSGVMASYRIPTLSVQLPAEVRVPAVIAAADEECRSRGYSVASSSATEDAGRLVARPPRTSDYPEAIVEASTLGQGTRVEITVRPLGDQEWSRSLLDGILRRLGR